MKKFRVLFIVMTIIISAVAVLGYGIYSNFNYQAIIDPFIKLFLSFVKFVELFIATPDFSFPNILYLAAIVIGPILSIIFAISQLRRKDFLGFIIGLLAPLFFVYALVGLFIPYYPNILPSGELSGARPYLEIFLEDINNNLVRAIIFGFVFGLTILVTFIIIITFLFGRKFYKKTTGSTPKNTKIVQSTATTTVTPAQPVPTVTPTVQAQLQSSAPSAFVPPVLPAQDQSLSELIKLVLQEEVSRSRSPFGTPTPQVDASYIHRIVREELAQFQMHFMSRAEAQLLVAQEIAALKAQLGMK
jgi:hypothetical protein